MSTNNESYVVSEELKVVSSDVENVEAEIEEITDVTCSKCGYW